MSKMNLIPLFLILLLFKTAYVDADEMPNDDSSDNKADCEKGWDQFGDHCYKLEGITYDTRLTWRGASSHCSELGGELASIHSKEENEFLTNKYAKNIDLSVWIGLHSSSDSSTYQWNDGSPNDFQNWARYQPMHYGNEDIYCVVLTGDFFLGEPGVWVVWRCSRSQQFICKKKPYVHHNEMTSVDSSRFNAPCEREWDIFRDHCYKLVGLTSGIPVTWKGASTRCSELGGHLASIHSKEENEFLKYSYAVTNEQYVWIGLYTSDDLSTYQWDDDSPKDYENWGRGEPRQEGEHALYCVILTDDNLFGKPGEWVDWNCNSFKPFICKKKSSSNMSTTPDITQERKSTISQISMKTTTPGIQEEITSSSNTSKRAFLTAVPYLCALFLVLLVITIAHLSRKWMKRKRDQSPVYNQFRESEYSYDARRPDVI